MVSLLVECAGCLDAAVSLDVAIAVEDMLVEMGSMEEAVSEHRLATKEVSRLQVVRMEHLGVVHMGSLVVVHMESLEVAHMENLEVAHMENLEVVRMAGLVLVPSSGLDMEDLHLWDADLGLVAMVVVAVVAVVVVVVVVKVGLEDSNLAAVLEGGLVVVEVETLVHLLDEVAAEEEIPVH